jgi:thioredoxin 1
MIKYLTNENFDEEIKNNTILVDFYADWCGPCKMLGSVLENVDFIDILKVNTDMHPDIAKRYGIMSIPTLLVFKNGELVNQSIGFKDIDEIKQMIK